MKVFWKIVNYIALSVIVSLSIVIALVYTILSKSAAKTTREKFAADYERAMREYRVGRVN